MRVLLINLLLVELGCAGLLWWQRLAEPDYFTVPWSHYVSRVDALQAEDIAQARDGAYHALRGWDNRPGSSRTETNSVGRSYTVSFDERGARQSAWSRYATLLAAYGDSHVLADEVSDEESWAVQLSGELRAGVENYGVAGYGPDQALLKLEAHLAGGRPPPPAVLLGMHEENIGRMLNSYRPFYLQRVGDVLAFKPRFRLKAGTLELLANPLPRLETVDQVRSALDLAASTDHWWAENRRKIHLFPPFSWRAIDLMFTVMDEDRLLAHPFKVPPERFPSSCRLPSLWQDSEAQALMLALVDRFMGLAAEHRFYPILLFLPCVDHVPVPTYLDTLEEIRQRYAGRDLSVVDMHRVLVGAPNFDRSLYRIRPEGGHLSAYGNRLVADALSRRVPWGWIGRGGG